MANGNYSVLKDNIDDYIKQNGDGDITGQVLQTQLFAMINSLGAGYQFMGVAKLTPTPTDPGSPDQNVFYVAFQPGIYGNFGSQTVADGEIAILKWNGSWTKEVTGAASAAKLDELGHKVDGKSDELPVTVGTGGTMTFTPIELSQNGDALEVQAIFEQFENANSAFAFSRYNGGIALSLNKNVIGLKDSSASWVSGMNASGGTYASPDAVNTGRKFKLVYENNVVNLYVSDLSGNYSTTPNLTVNSQPNVKIDTLCGSHSGYYWTGEIRIFNYTHNGQTTDVLSLPGFSSSGNLTFTQQADPNSLVSRVSKLETDIEDCVTEDELQDKESVITEKYIAPRIQTGYLVDSDTGELVAASGYTYVILDVSGGLYKSIRTYATAFGGNRGYGFVLDNGTWQGVHTTVNGDVTIQIPENAVTFKFCWNPGVKDAVHQYFYVGLQTTLQSAYEKNAQNIMFFPFLPDFNLLQIPETSFIPESKSLSDVYDRYDGLVADYPSYVTKIDCSSADSAIGVTRPPALDGMPIYIYKFSPVLSRNERFNPRPKAFIICGTHSNEKMGIYTVYSIMKMVCENWTTIHDAGLLRTMAEIYVLPILNPWGFVHTGETISGVPIPGRQNYNGVNLNRNFPTMNWELTETGVNYSGPTAGSEYETKIVMYYANLIKPDFFLDAHTGGMNSFGAMGAIEATQEDGVAGLAYAMARMSTTILMTEDSSFGESADVSLIDVNPFTATGEMASWAYENICRVSFLTEQCNETKWLNGVLTNSVQAYNTDTIYRENIQVTMNVILYSLYMASIIRNRSTRI